MATTVLLPPKMRPGVLYPRAQWYFLAAMATTWLGFARSYFAVLPTEPLLHHVHGALMGGWIGLLIVQPMLYQRNRMRLHRRLGRWGVFLLAPAIVVCGGLMVRSMVRSTGLPRGIVGQLAFLDVTALVMFPLFIGLSVFYARDVQLHARYIVCTVLLLMPPAWARALFLLPFMRHFQRNVNTAELMVSLVLVLLIASDLRRGRVRAAYPVALVLTGAAALASNFASGWGWWRGALGWIAGAGSAG